MNWFKRHLNWTYILAILCLAGVNLVLVLIMVGAHNYELDWILYIWTPILLLGLVGIPIWVIKQKGRSLWNLLWFLLGIGPIVVLCLENRAGNRLAQEKATDSEREAQ